MLPTYPSHIVFYVLATVHVSFLALIDAFSDDSSAPFLYSECLCWIILFLAGKVTEKDRRVIQCDGFNQPDKLALAVAASAVLWTWGESRWTLPLATPTCLLIASLDSGRPKLPTSVPEKPNGIHQDFLPEPSLPVKGLAFAILIAVASAALLFPVEHTTSKVSIGIYFPIALLAVYFFFYQSRRDAFAEDQTPSITIPALGISWRVAVILGMMLLIPARRSPQANLTRVALIAILKVVQWITVVELINRGFLLSVSTLATFVNSLLEICSTPLHSSRSEIVAGVALVSLAQTYQFNHKFPHSRRIALILVCLIFTGLVLRRPNTIHFDRLRSILGSQELHPIEILVEEANHKFADMIHRQSQTLDAAVAEYQRRYDRVPPAGFDKWFELAKEADCPIIDNFDTVMAALNPFWGLSAQEFRARATMCDRDPLAVMTVQNHTSTMIRDSLVLSHFNNIINEWTQRYQDMLPDMIYTVNGLAEPRVIVANDRLERLLRTCAPPAEEENNGTRKELEIMDLGKESSFQIGTRSCPENSPSRAVVIPEDEPGLLFVRNVTSAKDWCQDAKAAKRHGLFASPYNLKITDTLVPVFSHGKPSTSQDLLYPSPDYLAGYRSGAYKEQADGAWENKSNKLYWSGSDTGGFASGYEWRYFHRQRFVDLVSNGDNDVSLLRQNKPGRWEQYSDKMSSLADFVDVKFSDLTACGGVACSDEQKNLPVGARDEAEKMHEYKFLFDVDGMGRTERFYRLLGSRSTVLKQTMHQEWHDDRLVPWVHYIPVSLGMGELPEIIRFLTSTERGQKIGKDIANAGRSWQQKALREKDMELAFVRILLEYGRLYSAERDNKGYCPGGRVQPD